MLGVSRGALKANIVALVKVQEKENRMTKYERLQQARLITSDCVLTPEQALAIESLNDLEVEALIAARGKLAPVFKGAVAQGGIRMHCLLDANCQENG
jgi:hypothetical protein